MTFSWFHVETGFDRFLPVQADAALLPIWKVVEIDSICEEEFVLEGNRFSGQKTCRGLPLSAKQPITMRVKSVTARVFVSPTEIIDSIVIYRPRPTPEKQQGLCLDAG
jgi:hypothetical protein